MDPRIELKHLKSPKVVNITIFTYTTSYNLWDWQLKIGCGDSRSDPIRFNNQRCVWSLKCPRSPCDHGRSDWSIRNPSGIARTTQHGFTLGSMLKKLEVQNTHAMNPISNSKVEATLKTRFLSHEEYFLDWWLSRFDKTTLPH